MSRIRFARSTPESVGIPSAAIESLLDELEQSVECEPHALMVMRHGRVCAEGWWSPYAAGVPHALFSLTKTYTGTAIGLAYTEGLLDLDDKVIDYLPELASVGEAANARITIRHALAMATGKPLIRSDAADWRRHYLEIPFNAAPGARYEYSCEDTHILMAVVQKVSGASLHDYLKTRLFDRLGIGAEALKWAYLPDGSEVGCGGLFATAEDSLRLMKLYLDGGTWAGERVLAADFVAQASSKQIDNAGHGYGFQMHMGSAYRAFYGSGALGQLALAVPDLDMVIVLYQTGNYRQAGLADPEMPFRSAEYYFDGIGAIFRTLLPHANAGALPEDEDASDRLACRLGMLNLGKPLSRPVPAASRAIAGVRYRVVEGTFTLRNNLWNHITSGEPFDRVAGCEWLSFEFDRTDSCTLRFLEDEKEIAMEVGLDGISRLNSYPLRNLDVDKVLLDGAWLADDTFMLNARWVETCYSIGLELKFVPGRARVALSRVNGDYRAHPMRDGPVTAVAI